jgi:mannobiose 2-epimerase
MSLLKQLKEEMRAELIHGILPYWMGRMVDVEQGGFYGQIDGADRIIGGAGKGGILNARILWTFSSAYRVQPDSAYLHMAERAYGYALKYFFDEEMGGTYWLVNADGSPADTKKQIYSQAFFIYALTEYHMASGNEEALAKAKELFHLIEQHSRDTQQGGYFEAYSRDWQLLDDLRLSEKDENEKKTMNTHLHILEAYTNLYRVWKDPRLKEALEALILIFADHIIDTRTGHMNLFFDEQWTRKGTIDSYGHDIEASWLLYEAAQVLGDPALLLRVESLSLQLVQTTVREGLQSDGSIWYETDTRRGHTDTDRHWWPQAEAAVGFMYAWKLSGDAAYLDKSAATWQYISAHLIDRAHGEWYWSIRDGKPNLAEDKAGFWKCPYHNSRMCIEIIRA